MRFLRPLAVSLVIGLTVFVSSSGGRAQAPLVAAFHGIGDIATGTAGAGSAVRDATRVNGVLYAVGSTAAGNAIVCTNAPGTPSTPTGCQFPPIYNLDTPVLWTSAGGPTGTLTALPPGPAFPDQNLPGAPGSAATAYAITPGADFIASQAHYSTDITNTGTNWVLVTTSALPGSGANTSLNQLGASGFATLAISGDGPGGVVDGNVVYGQTTTAAGTRVATRYDFGGGGYTQPPVPAGLGYSNVWTLPVPRGTSQDGTVMIGVASPGAISGPAGFPLTTFADAFRYVHNVGSTLIPRLAGGTWNFPIAVSSDGNITLLGGNSPSFPNGEVYLYNAATATSTSLGSPNTVWTPRILGGMTADGVVAVTFANTPNGGPGAITGLGLPTGPNTKYGYLHNANGWFHLANALAAQNIDLASQGWDPTNIAITGVRTIDGMDLVFGQGRRRTVGVVNGVTTFVDGAAEGFVAEFPAGYLAGYAHPSPAPPGDASIIGAWGLGTNLNTATLAYFFMADGTYYEVSTGGFERGFYAVGADASYHIWTRRDADGPAISSNNGKLGRTVTIVGDTLTIADANCPGCAPITMTRAVPSTGTLLGGWVLGDPTMDDSSAAGMFVGSPTGGKYFFASDFEEQEDDQSEVGTWSYDGTTLTLSAITGNRNGVQFQTSTDSQPAHLTADDLGLVITDPQLGNNFTLKRIVNPATVLPAITNVTFAASGTEDGPFSFTVTAVNTLTYSATGLPSGVTIDADTGVISGTPAVNGTFNVEVTVTNTFGATSTRTLVLTVAAPPASIRGIGDLTGGNFGSAVRDATRVNGVIYAVGASVVNITSPTSFDLDTPALWTYTGGGSGTLTALPYGSGVSNTNTTARSAYALSSLDGRYIASQAQFTNSGTGTRWVRVDRNALPSTTANLDISSASGAPVAFAALSISENGDVLYGQGSNADGTRTPRRYQSGIGIQTVDISATGKTWGFPTPRGTSNDGSVMVGAASNGAFTGTGTSSGPFGYPIQSTNSVAFRYVHTANTLTGVTNVIPFAPGGTWNFPIAISGNGAETVVVGNSTAYPNGEIYLTNAANTVTATLGSPNTGMTPRLLGGRTDDGAVVVTFATFAQGGQGQIAGLQLPSSARVTYLHNGNGWFLLGSVLRQQGIDLEALGWNVSLLTVTGVHTVEGVDLVVGQGVRRTLDPATGAATDGAPEGFVIELPAGSLANFNPTVTAPADDALVGGWIVGPNPATPAGVNIFLNDGRYLSFTQGGNAYQNGSERGSYSWASNGGDYQLLTRIDHNAQFGQQNFSAGMGRTMTVAGDMYSIYNTHCNPGLAACATTAPRIVGDQSSIVGVWTATIPAGPFAGTAVTAVFLGETQGNRYFVDYDVPGSDDDFELGTYTYTQNTLTTIRDGGGGGADAGGAVLSRDGLQMLVDFDTDLQVTFTRVVRPATVVPVITSLLTAGGTLTQPFSYTITAMNGLTFGATGLPDGLTIDTDTGVISGTPTATGTTNVAISATNTFGATTNAQLAITVVKATQSTLSVVAPGSKPYGSQFGVSTTGGNGGGGVTFFAVNGCSVVGTTVTMTSGTVDCLLSATKDGDDTYDPTVSDSVTVIAEPKPASVTPNAATKVFGTADPASFSGSLAGFLAADNVTATYSRTPGETVNGGVPYTISATLAPSGVLSNYLITYNTASFTITKAGSTTGVVSSLGSSVYGQSVTFTATVTSAAGTPSGTVTFADGATTIGSASLNASGVATLTTATLVADAHTISATYGGADDYSGSSNSTAQSITMATTATALSSSPNPSSPGQTVNFVATVTGQYAGLVAGTVSFKKGQQILGTAEVLANGTATLPLSTLGTGSTVVTAIYGGDANNITSTSPSVTQNVVAPAAPTTTTLTSSLNPAVVGQSVTLTATVSSGTAGTITGTVDFKRGQTVLFTGTLVNGQATYTTTTLPQGNLSLTAAYSGNAQYIASTSAVLTQVVSQATTSTTLVSSPNPSAGGQLVTLTASITPSTLVTPIGGTVTFRRGSTVLGTSAVSGGQAVFTTTTLPAGASNLTAIYSGDATYVGSTSAVISHTVLIGTTTTTLTASPNPSTFGTLVTFTATVVTSVAGAVPTGTVEFLEGSTTLGTGTLDATGHATFSTSSLALKSGKTMTHNIKAKYLGDAYNGTSTSATYAQVVNP